MKNKRPLPSPEVSPWVVVWLTMALSALSTGLSLFLHDPDLGLGTALGGPFAVLNYLGLRILSAKLLNQGDAGRGPFWIWSLLRYGLIAAFFAALVQVSVLCLLGALAVYIGSLGILSWAGTKRSTLPQQAR